MGHTQPSHTGGRGCCSGVGRTRGAVEREGGAVARHGLAAPQLDHELERLVEQRRAGARVALLAEGAQLAPAVAAEAGAEDHAPAREAIEDGDLARDVPRAPARQRRDHRAQAHALGGQRDGGQRDPRIGDVEPVEGHDVVPHEEAVPAARLGLAATAASARTSASSPKGAT